MLARIARTRHIFFLGYRNMDGAIASVLPPPPACRFCTGATVVRAGQRKLKTGARQLYRCQACGRRFATTQPRTRRTPPAAIREALSLAGQSRSCVVEEYLLNCDRNTASGVPGANSTGTLRRLFGAAAILAGAAGYAPQAKAQGLIWDLNSVHTLGDYDEERPGDEALFGYTVFNLSSPGDANNLIRWTAPAGSNQGVYDTYKPAGWTADILGDSTVFSGSGSYIAPSQNFNRYFELYSTDLNTLQLPATAVSRGTGENPNQAFPQTPSATVPTSGVPEPGSAGIVCGVVASVNNNQALVNLSFDNLNSNLSYAVESSTGMVSWSPVCSFTATGVVHSVTVTNGSDRGVYRLAK